MVSSSSSLLSPPIVEELHSVPLQVAVLVLLAEVFAVCLSEEEYQKGERRGGGEFGLFQAVLLAFGGG